MNGNASLDDGWSAVQFFSDKMHGTAVPLVARIESALMRVQSRVLWQQRRMNVEYRPGKMIDKDRCENAHETGKNDQVRMVAIQRCDQRRVEILPGGVVSVFNAFDLDAGIPGALETGRMGLVAQDDAQIKFEIT